MKGNVFFFNKSWKLKSLFSLLDVEEKVRFQPRQYEALQYGILLLV